MALVIPRAGQGSAVDQTARDAAAAARLPALFGIIAGEAETAGRKAAADAVVDDGDLPTLIAATLATGVYDVLLVGDCAAASVVSLVTDQPVRITGTANARIVGDVSIPLAGGPVQIEVPVTGDVFDPRGRIAPLDDPEAALIAQWAAAAPAEAWGSGLNSSPWSQFGTGSTNGTITGQSGSGTVDRFNFGTTGQRIHSPSVTAGLPYGVGGWLHTDVAGTIEIRDIGQTAGQFIGVEVETGWNFIWRTGIVIGSTFGVTVGVTSGTGRGGDGLARNMAVDRWKLVQLA